MSLAKTWYTVDEAQHKLGVGKDLILNWVEEGIVRSEEDGTLIRVNIDDLEMKVREIVPL